ncbi:MAG TPA: TIGR01777 family oxidoreductase [Terracidiphilus sp.]|nr:TIGR01777 family oxidoreductase [Terracidiphilus sp.]
MPFNLPERRLRIVIPGGSGQIGTALARYFQGRGHAVTVLTRGPYAAEWQTVHWDGEHVGEWTETLEGADVCINLAGRSINCRYTAKNQDAILRSRVRSTRLLGRVIAGLAHPPRVWMNGSAANIYRHATDRAMDEETGEIGGGERISPRRRAPRKWDFPVRVALDWEAALFAAYTPGVRKVALRTSIVMGPEHGGAFGVLLNLVRLSLGGTQGNGRQMVSWIHELDFARAVEFLIEREDLDGPVNMTAPGPLPNREFMAELREAAGMPNGIPAPAPLLELGALLLRTETELVLKSRWIVPRRLLEAGFEFQFSEWRAAAEDLMRQRRGQS